jgi:hypothetical protein
LTFTAALFVVVNLCIIQTVRARKLKCIYVHVLTFFQEENVFLHLFAHTSRLYKRISARHFQLLIYRVTQPKKKESWKCYPATTIHKVLKNIRKYWCGGRRGCCYHLMQLMDSYCVVYNGMGRWQKKKHVQVV